MALLANNGMGLCPLLQKGEECQWGRRAELSSLHPLGLSQASMQVVFYPVPHSLTLWENAPG